VERFHLAVSFDMNAFLVIMATTIMQGTRLFPEYKTFHVEQSYLQSGSISIAHSPFPIANFVARSNT
jgi:hypothetical protein